MASKFQHRLVGTIVLVAIGVIVLPGVLDGKKKHYKEEFAAIPLVPKPGDRQDNESVPPVTQPLPVPVPEEDSGVMTEDNRPPAAPPLRQENSTPEADSVPAQPPVDSTPPAVSPPPEQSKKAPVTSGAVASVKPTPPEKKPDVSAPAGQAWIVQLGALKNAARTSEIVAQLRLSGYRAFTVPATPVQGEINRIYVGPDVSKAKLQASLTELKGLSGLNGVVKPWSVH